MIGLSLSFCIQDIIDGLVNIDDVERLVTGTRWTEADIQERLDYYCTNYWNSNPELARQVFWQLWNSGRIEQPRLQGDESHRLININTRGLQGHWRK